VSKCSLVWKEEKIRSAKKSPETPSRITFTKIKSGKANNISKAGEKKGGEGKKKTALGALPGRKKDSDLRRRVK